MALRGGHAHSARAKPFSFLFGLVILLRFWHVFFPAFFGSLWLPLVLLPPGPDEPVETLTKPGSAGGAER